MDKDDNTFQTLLYWVLPHNERVSCSSKIPNNNTSSSYRAGVYLRYNIVKIVPLFLNI